MFRKRTEEMMTLVTNKETSFDNRSDFSSPAPSVASELERIINNVEIEPTGIANPNFSVSLSENCVDYMSPNSLADVLGQQTSTNSQRNDFEDDSYQNEKEDKGNMDVEDTLWDDNEDQDPDYIPSGESTDDENSVIPLTKRQKLPSCAPGLTLCNDNNKTSDSSLVQELVDSSVKSGRKCRRKIAKPELWKRNVHKEKVRHGKSYTVPGTSREKLHKGVKPCDCNKCIRNCNKNFSDEDRERINCEYWSMGCPDKQRQYLSSLIENKDKTVKRTENIDSRRQKTRLYYLVKNNELIQVCQKFFLTTFNISDTVVKNVIRKRKDSNIVEPDQRGRHEPGVKRPEDSKVFIINHIASFPKVPSHYTRKDSKKEYLPADLNVSKMYNLYVDKCKIESKVPEKISYYREIFEKEFNLTFHVPVKNRCDLCYTYENNMTDDVRLIHQDEYKKHVKQKELARELKEDFKSKAKSGQCTFMQFDFEAVRYCPHISAKAIFYKRRLAVLNLTLYDVATDNSLNYMWHEGTAGRGSVEVASCLFNYMKNHQNLSKWVFMSDTCGGQNRNRTVVAMFMYAVQVLDIDVIDQIFFVPGHSQMECDTVHAHIESTTKNLEIFDPSGWYTAVRLSSKKNKYQVKEVSQAEVFDFKEIKKELLKNTKFDVQGNLVNWLKITWFQFRKNDPLHVYIKCQHDEEFNKIKICRRERRGFWAGDLELKNVYKSPLKLQKEKVNDLLQLCDKGIIREQYHTFYRALQAEENGLLGETVKRKKIKKTVIKGKKNKLL